MIGFTPLGNRVVIKADRVDNAPEVLPSGVLLATNLTAAVEGTDAQDSWCVGTVVAIGPLVHAFNGRAFTMKQLQRLRDVEEWRADRVLQQLDLILAKLRDLPHDCPDPLKVGDRVTFSWASGQELTLDDQKFLIMAASDVLAVLEPEYA